MARRSIEILYKPKLQIMGQNMLDNIAVLATNKGYTVRRSEKVVGDCDTLMLYGVGYGPHAEARNIYEEQRKTSILWDLGYFERARPDGHLRLSVWDDHPSQLLWLAPNDALRWDKLNIKLEDRFNPEGPIILVGLGIKSVEYLGEEGTNWLQNAAAVLRERYPGRRIIHRPKPGKPFSRVGLEVNVDSPIEELLRGASLVVARHSNVALDAIRMNIPIAVSDGIAVDMQHAPYTDANRLDFFRKLAWFQWRPSEAAQALDFIEHIIEEKS